MSFLRAYLNQAVTHWVKTGIDGFNQPTFDPPKIIYCRWEEKSEQVVNDVGDTVLSRARVFLGKDIAIGDFLYLGSSSEADPRNVVGAWRVLNYSKTPNLLATDFERKAYL